MSPVPIVLPTIFPVTCHTDFVGEGTTFVAIEGYCENGINYIERAIQKGARTIVINDKAILSESLCRLITEHQVMVMRVDNTRQALSDLSAQAAGFPAQKVKIIGITGTKGKTTTAFLLEHCLRAAGYKTGLISSAGNSVCGTMFPPSLTTPQPDYLQQFLKVCVDNGVEYVVMEVAAQALTLHRVRGIEFDGVIFTNFSHEHLEFYATLDDYYAAKCLIFDMVKPHAPLLINSDDEYGVRIQEQLAHKNLKTYGFLCALVHYKGYYQSAAVQSVCFTMQCDNRALSINCPALCGQYNAYNILAALSMMHALGMSLLSMNDALKTFKGVPGRLQYSQLPNGARAVIDYAHNPSSFHAVLSTLRQLTHHLIVLFGAGGGKDILKRPIMGSIACKYADVVILTADNPRREDINDIMYDIQKGITLEHQHKVIVEVDRAVAIHTAYAYSQPGSIIALLGKGPDEYQIIGTVKSFFSEKNILQELR